MQWLWNLFPFVKFTFVKFVSYNIISDGLYYITAINKKGILKAGYKSVKLFILSFYENWINYLKEYGALDKEFSII